jgi:hypothetical protein
VSARRRLRLTGAPAWIVLSGVVVWGAAVLHDLASVRRDAVDARAGLRAGAGREGPRAVVHVPEGDGTWTSGARAAGLAAIAVGAGLFFWRERPR